MSSPSSGQIPAPHGRVIVMTGPPGAGKSTVATMLADRVIPSVHLQRAFDLGELPFLF